MARRCHLTIVPEIRHVTVPLLDWCFLTFDKADRLVAHADDIWRRMITVALNTGLRRGELLGLRWEDVDLERGKIRVVENYVRGQFKAPKSGKPREIPLNARARQTLAESRHTRGAARFVAKNRQETPMEPLIN